MRLDKTKVSAEHLKYRRNLKRRKIIIHAAGSDTCRLF